MISSYLPRLLLFGGYASDGVKFGHAIVRQHVAVDDFALMLLPNRHSDFLTSAQNNTSSPCPPVPRKTRKEPDGDSWRGNFNKVNE